jgi:hypothetical protein
MKKRLSVAARYISLVFILTFGVISIIGSGGGGGGGGGGTAIINEDNIRDIAQGIIDSTLIGDGFLEEFGDLQIPEGACEDDGTITTLGSIGDPPEVDDTITVTFNDCQEFGVITNGIMTVTIKEVSADFDGTPPYNLSVEILLINLSSEDIDLGLVATVTGDMTITISEDGAGELRVKIEGDSLTTQWDGEVETLSDFLFEMVDNSSTLDFSKDLNGTIGSTLLGGSVTFATTTLFTGKENVAGGEPTAGELHITNSIDNSQALLIAREDGTGLEIKVDADGDGDYEFEDFISYDNL